MTKKEIFKITQITLAFLLFCFSYLIKDELILLIYNITTFVVIGCDVIWETLIKIVHLKFFDEEMLMLIAAICAFLIKEYHEGIIVLILFQIGDLFERVAVKKSKKNIKALINLKPEYANIEQNGEIVKVKPQTVNINDLIIVKPYEKIPLDGVVVSGSSSINEASITGESRLKDVKEEDYVYSGTINQNGKLKVKVLKTYENGEVMKILKLISEAESKKTKSEKFVSKFAKFYTPLVILIALFVAAVLPFIFKEQDYTYFLKMASQFLVISCPCALVISVPLASFLSIGQASKKGILIKGSAYLETISNVKTFIFDKTGTLTKGEFKIKEVKPHNISKEELLEIAAIAEQNSNHPLAKAINKEVKLKKEINYSNYRELPGLGVEVLVDDKVIRAGNIRLMETVGITAERESAKSVIYFSVNNTYAGSIILEDEIKETAKETIKKLKQAKIKTAILSGDQEEVVEKIKNELEIDEAKSELKPEDKLTALNEYLEKTKVAYVGDGINDSPCLKRADIGIAMGSLGSDAAIECSDIIIMDDNLLKINEAIKLSKRTKGIIIFNIIFILVVKIAIMITSVFYQNFYLAITSDVGVSVVAILNAMRLLKNKE